MANITEVSEFTAGVPELATNTQAIGGPGGAMNSQAQALANRTKYLKDQFDALGDSATKDVGIGAGDVAAGNAPAAAQAAAEATAAGALAGHVSALDPHTQYAKEADLGDSAGKNVGTGAGDVAAGDAPAGAVTTHESTYAHANLPTAAGKTAADAIGAASGADTGAKIKTLVGDAATSNKGVALLGASGGAAKLTDRPDGDVTPAYLSNFSTTNGWNASVGLTLGVTNGELIITATQDDASTRHILKTVAVPAGASLLVMMKSTLSNYHVRFETNELLQPIYPLKRVGRIGEYQLFIGRLGKTVSSIYFYPFYGVTSGGLNAVATIKFMWFGDYSYKTGSCAEDGLRILNQLSDCPGVGSCAIGSIIATDLATAGKGDIIGEKKYTFVDALTPSPGVEGEVLKAATKEEEIENENLAISEVSRANNGIKYWAAAVHPLVSTTRSGAVLNISAKTTGLWGDIVALTCEPGTNHSASGTHLTGGMDDVGGKIIEQLKYTMLRSLNFELLYITRDVNELISTATVIWADGSLGVITYGDYNATAVAYDSFIVTHINSGLTVTQPKVTRNAANNITTKPMVTIK